MKDQEKTKEQLINELNKLRQRINRLEVFETESQPLDNALIQAEVEREKQVILDTLMEHVIYHDPEMRVLWANQAACESAGMTREELMGRSCYEIWANRSDPCEDCPVRLSRDTGDPHAIEKMTPDGRFWRIQASPVFDIRGRIVGIVELTLDITQRKLAEEALRKSEDRHRSIVETIPHGIQEIDSTGTITFANPAHNKIYGYSDKEILGKTILDLQISDSAKTALKGYLDTLVKEQPKPTPYIGKNFTKGGRIIDVQVDWTYKRDDQGRVTGFISVVTNITEQKRVEKALQKARDELEQRITERTAELLKSNEQLRREIEKRKVIEKDLQESQEKYRSVVESANEAIIVAQDEMLKFANPKIAEITGYSMDELLSRPFINFVHPDDQQKVMDYQTSRLSGEEILTYPLRIIHKNGSTRWFEHNGISITWSGRPATLSFLNDITERKQADEALRESEEKYRELFENESDAVMIFDAETLRFEDANRATLNLYGYSKQEFLALAVEDISAEKEKTKIAVPKVKNGKPDSKFVALRYFRKKDGSIFPGEICAGSFISGERKKIIGAVRDITERIQAEEALRQNEKRFQKIVESAPFGYYRLGKDGRYQYVNPEWESIHGLSGREIIGKSVEVTEADDNKARVLEYFHRALDGQTIKGESKRILKNGLYGYHEFTIQPVYQNREIVAIEGFINDLTEQKRNEDLVRNLSHLLMQAQERERQMISYELHDRIAQNLSTLKIESTMLFEGQPTISRELEPKIGRMSKLIELIITSVRDLAYNLRPPGLNEMSIVKAVETYCEEFSESSGLDVDFQSTGMHALDFDYDTKLHLYRLVQEGLNNIRKHADAARATVKIIGASPNIIVRIEDNGKGFDVKERELSLDSRKRMGLRSMQERVYLLGGRMTIRSRPMAGTKIFIKFPFKEKESDSEKAHINRR